MLSVCFSIIVLQFAGQLRLCVAAGCPWKPSIKGGVQHLVQVSGGDKVQVGSDVGRELLEVLLVAFGEDDALHSCPVGRQDLVLDPAHLRRTDQSRCVKTMHRFTFYCVLNVMTHRQHQPPERDLPCHGNV